MPRGLLACRFQTCPTNLQAGLHYDPTAAAKLKAVEAVQAKAQAGAKIARTVEAENIIIKRVEAPGMLWGTNVKFRYFIALKNRSPSDLTVEVEIALLGKAGDAITRETFNGIAPGGLEKVLYLDSFVGPAAFHEDACVSAFSYKVTSGADIVGAGRAPITEKFEDTIASR